MSNNINDQLAQALEHAGDHIMLAPHSEHCQLGYAGNDCTCGLWALMSTITDALNAYRASKEGEKAVWRKASDLPEDDGEGWEHRCIVTWTDADNPGDIGMETSCIEQIRDGDFSNPRYKDVWWRTAMDSPSFADPSEQHEH